MSCSVQIGINILEQPASPVCREGDRGSRCYRNIRPYLL